MKTQKKTKKIIDEFRRKGKIAAIIFNTEPTEIRHSKN